MLLFDKHFAQRRKEEASWHEACNGYSRNLS